METVVMLTVTFDGISEADRETFDAEIAALGFSRTMPASEGGELVLPDGSYAMTVQGEDTKEIMTRHYRAFVKVMRQHDLHGRYHVLACHDSGIVVGRL